MYRVELTLPGLPPRIRITLALSLSTSNSGMICVAIACLTRYLTLIQLKDVVLDDKKAIRKWASAVVKLTISSATSVEKSDII